MIKQRIGKKNHLIYAFDIESHNDSVSMKRQETSIWLGCLIDDESKMTEASSYVYNMDEFLDRLDEMTKKKRKYANENRPCNNICIYIYNLSFEWSFILPVLLKRRFEYKERINNEDSYCYNSISTPSVSSVWLINLKFGKNNGTVMFRDMSKIYGGGLGKVAKSFNLPTQKGSINYQKYRLGTRDEPIYQPSAKELVYCFCDTRIIIDIILKLIEMGDKTFFQISSMASYAMKNLIKYGYPKEAKPFKAFREEYPILSEDETKFLRQGVGGGITYAPKPYQFITIEKPMIHIDAHQMHPSQCYLKQFPYGFGTYGIGKPQHFFGKINCCRIRISYTDVKLHSIISLIGLDFIEDRELVVWDFEIPTMLKCYVDLKIKYIDYYEYKAKPLRWKKFYSDNYKLRLVAKHNKDDFNTLRYKLLNNSSYGKFLEKPHNEIFKNIVNEAGIITSLREEKDLLEQDTGAKYTYLPIGSAIPAYSRVTLIELALLMGWENICYFDTDSIFAIYNEKTKYVWENQVDQTDFLGGWGLEEIIDRAQFIAPKRYKTEVDGKATIKAGGINFDMYKKEAVKQGRIAIAKGQNYADAEIPFDEINLVNSTMKVQRAFRVKGGTLIQFQEKTMSVQAKYENIYNDNIDKKIN